MKITDVLDQLVRLVLTEDESEERGARRTVSKDTYPVERILGSVGQRKAPTVRPDNDISESAGASDAVEPELAAGGPDAEADSELADVGAFSLAPAQERPKPAADTAGPDLEWARSPLEEAVALDSRALARHRADAVDAAELDLHEAEPTERHREEPLATVEEGVRAESSPSEALWAHPEARALPELEPEPLNLEAAPTSAEAEQATVAPPGTEPERALVPAARELAHLETAAEVVESLNLGFHLGSAVERIVGAAVQGSAGIPALRQAAWLIERYIGLLERRPIGADLHLSAARLARTARRWRA